VSYQILERTIAFKISPSEEGGGGAWRSGEGKKRDGWGRKTRPKGGNTQLF